MLQCRRRINHIEYKHTEGTSWPAGHLSVCLQSQLMNTACTRTDDTGLYKQCVHLIHFKLGKQSWGL